jgi:hypothetical protein
MTMTSNTRCMPASALWAIAPVARRRNVRSRCAAPDHDRDGAAEADRVARTLRERQLLAPYRSRDDLAALDEVAKRRGIWEP